MTFAEFQEQELDCEECPIRKAKYCGYATCREFSSDLPCSFADPDQDMDDWVRQKDELCRRYEARQELQERKERERKEVARKRTETARQIKSYCRLERQEISRLQKEIRSLEKIITTAECWVAAFNSTNKMFGYAERKQVSPKLTAQLEISKERLKVAEEKYKQKRKDFYATRRNEQ